MKNKCYNFRLFGVGTIITLTFLSLLSSCKKVPMPVLSVATQSSLTSLVTPSPEQILIKNVAGTTLKERFLAPTGFQAAEKTAFALFISKLKLKPDGTLPVSSDNLTQTDLPAEAVFEWENLSSNEKNTNVFVKIYAQYLYEQQRFDEIGFHFVSGFYFEYNKWAEGYRIKVNNKDVVWAKSAQADNSPEQFQKYLQTLFAYINTKSLEQDLQPNQYADIASDTSIENLAETLEIGDFFPSSGIMIMDVARKDDVTLVLLARGNSPATAPYIIKNETDMSPWFTISDANMLYLDGESLSLSQARRFK